MTDRSRTLSKVQNGLTNNAGPFIIHFRLTVTAMQNESIRLNVRHKESFLWLLYPVYHAHTAKRWVTIMPMCGVMPNSLHVAVRLIPDFTGAIRVWPRYTAVHAY